MALFSPDSDLVAQSVASLRVVTLAMLIVIPGHMWFVGVLGTGDTTASLGIEFILALTMLGLAYFAAIRLAWPVELVWVSVPSSWLVCLAASYGWMRSGFWKRLQI